jgi:hypothetical protein
VADHRDLRRHRRRLLSRLALLAAGCVAAVAMWGSELERRLIFHPSTAIEETPADVGLIYEEVSFAADDGTRLFGWFVPAPGPWTFLWLHGNAGNISHRVDNLRLVHDLVGAKVLIFDYRGYGRSAGTPTEEGTYRDAEAALAYLRARPDVDGRRIVYFGRSLGSAVAADLAVKAEPAGLILESPFLSIRAMARAVLPFVPLGPLLRTRYDCLEKVRRLTCPLLVIHGDEDRLVPYSQGRRLFEAAKQPKTFYTVRSAGHNDTYIVGGEAYFAAITRFLESLS